MKREELKEWIELYFEDIMSPLAVEHSTNEFMEKIDEYTKPKTKKKSLEERKIIFKDKLRGECVGYEYELLGSFFEYWTEHNEGGSKMRFEMSKNQPFNIKRRLATWKKNQKNYNNGNKPATTQNRNATEDDINNYINS